METNSLPCKRIVNFIKRHHVLTLATSAENIPWTANCFYVYIEEDNLLVFTSDKETRHISEAIEQSQVAGSIVLETSSVGKIQGIQFQGLIYEPVGKELKKIRTRFLLRFPYAVVKNTTMWVVRLSFIKMTDNRLGFGKKLYWPTL